MYLRRCHSRLRITPLSTLGFHQATSTQRPGIRMPTSHNDNFFGVFDDITASLFAPNIVVSTWSKDKLLERPLKLQLLPIQTIIIVVLDSA
ncbi:predicted protein [Botrytis cinerea T4]|uniref:Uncharacterized protein n=1 Tax=Botryotinia fuckeliana (strain T4) TaxID=999810 RepID=G2XXZ3_BOTF4|nr:predicted protein [Botrytis cinerea T4]